MTTVIVPPIVNPLGILPAGVVTAPAADLAGPGLAIALAVAALVLVALILSSRRSRRIEHPAVVPAKVDRVFDQAA